MLLDVFKHYSLSAKRLSLYHAAIGVIFVVGGLVNWRKHKGIRPLVNTEEPSEEELKFWYFVFRARSLQKRYNSLVTAFQSYSRISSSTTRRNVYSKSLIRVPPLGGTVPDDARWCHRSAQGRVFRSFSTHCTRITAHALTLSSSLSPLIHRLRTCSCAEECAFAGFRNIQLQIYTLKALCQSVRLYSFISHCGQLSLEQAV